jgi:hypothetical protein
MAAIFGLGIPFGLLLLFGSVVMPLWAFFDALSRPATAFYAAGSNKTAWVMVIVVTFFLGFGFFLSAYYLIGVRRKVRQAMVR